MDPTLPIEKVIRLVKLAIERVSISDHEWKAAECDPSSTSEERCIAKHRLESAEKEFGWQWKNVERILKEKNL